jgi:ubiquinone biosynthesis protein
VSVHARQRRDPIQSERLAAPPASPGDSGLAALAIDLRRSLAAVAAAARVVGLPGWMRPLTRARPARAQRLRAAFEDLGLAYLKLGQFLAMRHDLLPREMCDELGRLFDHVEPVPFDEVDALVRAELGMPVEEVFSSFGTEPIAAASVAQVHRAVTVDGRRVAVKVQRPGIEREFASDMRNLRRIARLTDRLGLLAHMSATEVAGEFIDWTAGELDFVSEARTADRLRGEALPFEVVPRVHWDLVTRRLLTMEFIEGISLNEATKLLERGGEELLDRELPGVDMRLVAHRVINASMRQLFVSGFFHGDPHPGNLLIRGDNTVAFVDFGIFGELRPYHRRLMIRMIESLSTGDIDRAFRAFSAITDATDGTDPAAFEADAKQVLRRWYESATGHAAPEDRHLGKYITEILEVTRRHRVRMHWDLALFWRTMHALDTTAQKLPQYFDTLAEMRDFFVRTGGSPAQRVREVVSDLGWQLDEIHLQRHLMDSVLAARMVAAGHLPWRPDFGENRHMELRYDRGAKALTAATLALSAGVLAASPSAAFALQAAGTILMPLLLVTAALQARV